MIYGTPARSLTRGTFGTQARRSAGVAGEYLTAGILNGFEDRAAIFHDLRIPGRQENIDHAVLAGKNLLLIDSKMWKAGRYWSVFGFHFREFERRDKPSQNVATARDRFRQEFPELHVPTPLVVLWAGAQRNHIYTGDKHGHPTGVMMHPERTARPFLHFNYPGGRTITGNSLYSQVRSFVRFQGAPHQPTIRRLTGLLN